METFFLSSDDIFIFYERLSRHYRLYVPVRRPSPHKIKCEYNFTLPGDDFVLREYSQTKKEDIVFSEYRCVEPTRSFFTYYKEELGGYFSGKEAAADKEKPVAVCGVKNCDLFALKVQDYVFLEGQEQDPLYKPRRENALIIASDCSSFKEVCFCRAFDINPHPAEGFDFNLSPITNGYLLDMQGPKAKALAPELADILSEATVGQLSGRSAKRDAVIKRLDEHLSHHKIPKKETLQDIVLSGYNSQLWQEESKTCVECGGCVMMCDTCHCFLLADEPSQANAKRMRVWDGCLFKNFTRVAGGANPLKMRYMRLRNRYLKKFDFFISNLGFQACCGCGRCIDVCPGRIDIRSILRKLHDEKYLSAH